MPKGSKVIKITTQGRTSIPQWAMEELALDPGDFLQAEVSGGKLILTPVKFIPRGEADE